VGRDLGRCTPPVVFNVCLHGFDVLLDAVGLRLSLPIHEYFVGVIMSEDAGPVGVVQWTCVVGEFANDARMVTVAKWSDGAIAEEYIWS
jgi:hypothetical protein